MRLLPLVLVALAHGPLLFVYFQQLWDRPHYQFYPLVLGAAAYFIRQRWHSRHLPEQREVLLSEGLLLVCSGMLTYAFLRLSPMCAYVSLVLVIGAMLLRLGVPARGPWMLLWLIVRIPYGQDVALIQWMQRLTADLSSAALESLGVEHIAEGNVLLFPATSLFVEEACSGVVSLLAIVACAGILAVWWRRALLHALLLLGTGIFLAGAMNVVRVVVIAVALDRFGINLTEGWRHETVGLAVFAISLIAMFSADRLLLFLLGPIERNPLATYWDDVDGNILVSFWNRYVGLDHYGRFDDEDEETLAHSAQRPARPIWQSVWDWAMAAVCLLVWAGQVQAGIGPFSAPPDVSAVALDLSEDNLPLEWNRWSRNGFEVLERDSSSAFGEHSRIWAFQRGSLVVRVSLDFVFPEWHSLDACYQGVGWTLESSDKHRPVTDAPFVEAALTKPNGDRAFLLYDLFDDEGRPYSAPAGTFLHPTLRRVLSGQSNRWNLPNYYQVQALAVSTFGPMTEEHRSEVRQLFQWFRGEMVALLASAATPAKEQPGPTTQAATLAPTQAGHTAITNAE